MAPKERAKEQAITVQDQEVHNYYQAWVSSHGYGSASVDKASSIAAHDLHMSGYQPKMSKDKALTAFAQLSALRLDVRRAMISLIDSERQYILTESTKTSSLVTDIGHDKEDELWLGNTILNRADAVCEHCFTNTASTADHNGDTYLARGLIVNDCRADDRFKDRTYVKEERGVRFYAGVPIVSRAGHTIGVFAVSDDKTHNGLTAAELKFLQEISSAVMDHLEWAKDRVNRFKGERIVKGLASFIAGCSHARMKSGPARTDSAGHHQSDHSKVQEAISQEEKHTRLSASESEQHDTDRGPLRPSDTESDNESVHSVQSTDFNIKRNSDDSAEDEIAIMMGRAAKLLRRSTLAQGVVFFGPTESRGQASALQAVQEEQVATYPDASVSKHAAGHCEVLGVSLSTRTEALFVTNNTLELTVLEKYFKAYPEGTSLQFTKNGFGFDMGEDYPSDGLESESSASDSETPQSKRTRKCKKHTHLNHESLARIMPGVRTLVFLPIKDLVNDKTIAGCFLWTSSAGRMLSLSNDFSYLKAFSNGIASEISRMNFANLDKAKTTFIASMSHELRSPLHGILGSVEFLQDTAQDAYQSGLVTSIANCGRTLLDTLSNLLSYAKVSTLEGPTATTDVDLGVLVEEVLEAVCAGHAFKKMNSAKLATSHGQSNLARNMHTSAKDNISRLHSDDKGHDQLHHTADGSVSVLFDISPSVSWNVNVNPGALRRIIMNLVGNALKYTKHGFVGISLRAQMDGDRLETTLRVVDSGKGISEDFLNKHLFTPFQQEDTFASGTGLGLSIVKQLTENLGGTIRVTSTVGKGTEVEVLMSLPLAPEGVDWPDDEVRTVAAKTNGLRLCVLDPNREKQAPEREHIRRLDTTLCEICSTWFGLEITVADNMPSASTDFFLYTEPPSLEYLMEHHGGQSENQTTPLIIVCMNAQEAISISQQHSRVLRELGRIVELIPQPCGPRKLAKVLEHCLRRKGDMSGSTDHKKPLQRHEDGLRLHCGSDQKVLREDDRPARTGDQSSSQGPQESRYDTRNSAPDGARKSDHPERNETMPPFASSSIPFSKATELPLPRNAPPLSAHSQSSRSVEAAAYEPRPPQSDAGEAEHVPMHLLLVDDNKINLDLLVKFVRKCRLTYEEAFNGQEAVDKFKQARDEGRHFDHILMDISMPVMDGIEATKQIRRFEDSTSGIKRGASEQADDNATTSDGGGAVDTKQRTHIVALSAFASKDTQKEAQDNGVDVYLSKPVRFGDLKKLLGIK